MNAPTFARGKMGDAALALHVRDIHAIDPGYGSRRVHTELAALGINVSRKRVIRLMREREIAGAREARKPAFDLAYAPRIVERGTVPAGLNQVWCGDTTQVLTADGWLYLTVWIDLRSRYLVGWAMGETNDAALAVRALRDAFRMRRPARGLIVHSDRGSQFSSAEFRAVLAFHGCIQSMSRAGNCHDNACVESFFAGAKRETGVRKMRRETRAKVRVVLARYLAVHYNDRRRHTAREHAPAVFETLPESEQAAILARTAARNEKRRAARLALHAKRRETERAATESARAALS